MNIDLEKQLSLAEKTFHIWKRISFEERQLFIKKAAEIIENKAEEYGKIITGEMGKPISQSVAEVKKSGMMTAYYAEVGNSLKNEIIPSEYEISEIHYEPKGAILGVMPWNFPFWQVLRFAVPTILAGNTVVLKHASICRESGDAIEKLFLEAGFPEGVFQHLKIGHSEVQEVLEHKAVKGVSLTGSGAAGSTVASVAGKEIKKSLLELGGSDAFIVLDDADLLKAAETGALARLQNCGQTCVAAKRFIIQKSVKDEFLNHFIKEYQTFVPGNSMDKETKISGMARPDLADELEAQYKKALGFGAEILLPLKRISETVFQPGLILVEVGNPILQKEIFGPLGMVLLAENDEEALKLANDIPFGLANSVWTNDKERQRFFIENLESGTVNINKMTSSDPRFPFGGTKASGYGTELSHLALKEFVNVKMILG